MRLLILIPAYNEEESIATVVDHLISSYPQYDYVVINDGSKDRTKQICEEHNYNLINERMNLGLAGTIQTGMKFALKHGYDAAVQFDADGQHRPEYIDSMIRKIEEGYDVVIGSRFVDERKPTTMRMLGSNMIQAFIKLVTGKNISDPTSGMRMYSRRVIKAMAENINMGPEPDTVAYLIKSGADICEVQVKMDDRIAGESYLTAWRSIQYMISICFSIIFVVIFRPKVKFEEK